MKFVNEMMDIAMKMKLAGNYILIPIYDPAKSSKDDFETIVIIIDLVML